MATNVGFCPGSAGAATMRRTDIAVMTTSSARRNVRTRFFIEALQFGKRVHRLAGNRNSGEPNRAFHKCQYFSANSIRRSIRHSVIMRSLVARSFVSSIFLLSYRSRYFYPIATDPCNSTIVLGTIVRDYGTRALTSLDAAPENFATNQLPIHLEMDKRESTRHPTLQAIDVPAAFAGFFS